MDRAVFTCFHSLGEKKAIFHLLCICSVASSCAQAKQALSSRILFPKASQLTFLRPVLPIRFCCVTTDSSNISILLAKLSFQICTLPTESGQNEDSSLSGVNRHSVGRFECMTSPGSNPNIRLRQGSWEWELCNNSDGRYWQVFGLGENLASLSLQEWFLLQNHSVSPVKSSILFRTWSKKRWDAFFYDVNSL